MSLTNDYKKLLIRFYELTEWEPDIDRAVEKGVERERVTEQMGRLMDRMKPAERDAALKLQWEHYQKGFKNAE